MATRADFYRARAAECEEAANAATAQKVKQTYSELAQQWRDLARQSEQRAEDDRVRDND